MRLHKQAPVTCFVGDVEQLVGRVQGGLQFGTHEIEAIESLQDGKNLWCSAHALAERMRATIVIAYVSCGITPDGGQRNPAPNQEHQFLLITLEALGHCLNECERFVEITQRLDARCTLCRALRRCLPVLDRRLNETCLREV